MSVKYIALSEDGYEDGEKTPTRAFDPDQQRDEKGKWVEGGDSEASVKQVNTMVDDIMKMLDEPSYGPKEETEEETAAKEALAREQERIRAELAKIPKPPDNVVKAFRNLADDQRGDPENRMLDVHKVSNGHVIDGVVEHTGDIINRMTKDIQFSSDGSGNVWDKAEKSLVWLNNPANKFGREEYSPKLNAALDKYAEAHSKLTVFNEPQWQARQAAVEVGKQNWPRARERLEWLLDLSKDRVKFRKEAWKYDADADGNPKPWSPEKLTRSIRAFNPDQQRDENGRWTSDGGGKSILTSKDDAKEWDAGRGKIARGIEGHAPENGISIASAERLLAGKETWEDVAQFVNLKESGEYWYGVGHDSGGGRATIEDAQDFTGEGSESLGSRWGKNELEGAKEDEEAGRDDVGLIVSMPLILVADRPRGWNPDDNPSGGLVGNSYIGDKWNGSDLLGIRYLVDPEEGWREIAAPKGSKVKF